MSVIQEIQGLNYTETNELKSSTTTTTTLSSNETSSSSSMEFIASQRMAYSSDETAESFPDVFAITKHELSVIFDDSDLTESFKFGQPIKCNFSAINSHYTIKDTDRVGIVFCSEKELLLSHPVAECESGKVNQSLVEYTSMQIVFQSSDLRIAKEDWVKKFEFCYQDSDGTIVSRSKPFEIEFNDYQMLQSSSTAEQSDEEDDFEVIEEDLSEKLEQKKHQLNIMQHKWRNEFEDRQKLSQDLAELIRNNQKIAKKLDETQRLLQEETLECQSLKRENSSLTQQINENITKKANFEQLEIELAKVKADFETLKLTKISVDQKCVKQSRFIEEQKKQLLILKGQIQFQSLESIIKDEKTQELTRKFEDLERIILNHKTEMQKLKKEHASELLKLNASLDEKTTEFEIQNKNLEILRENYDNLEKNFKACTLLLKKIEDEKENALLERDQNLLKWRNELNAELDKKNKEISTIIQKITELTKQVNEKEQKLEQQLVQIEACKSEVEFLRSEKAKLEFEIRNNQTQAQQMSKMTLATNKFYDKFEQLKLVNLSKSSNDATSDKFESLFVQIQYMLNQDAKRKKQFEEMREKLESSDTRVAELSHENEVLTQENDELKRQIAVITGKLANRVNQKNSLDSIDRRLNQLDKDETNNGVQANWTTHQESSSFFSNSKSNQEVGYCDLCEWKGTELIAHYDRVHQQKMCNLCEVLFDCSNRETFRYLITRHLNHDHGISRDRNLIL